MVYGIKEYHVQVHGNLNLIVYTLHGMEGSSCSHIELNQSSTRVIDHPTGPTVECNFLSKGCIST